MALPARYPGRRSATASSCWRWSGPKSSSSRTRRRAITWDAAAKRICSTGLKDPQAGASSVPSGRRCGHWSGLISASWRSAPYSAEVTLQGKTHLEAHGFEIVKFDHLRGFENIYDTTAEHAYALARSVDAEDAEAVFLSGTGMPTASVLEALEQDLGKPVLSSASAMMWHALRLGGGGQPIP